MLWRFESPESIPISPISELIESAFDEPIDFPPLPLALIEDDHIALAIEDGVPDANEIAISAARYLVEHGTRQEMLSIVLGSDNQYWRDRLVSELQTNDLGSVKVIKHEPTHHDSHGYIRSQRNRRIRSTSSGIWSSQKSSSLSIVFALLTHRARATSMGSRLVSPMHPPSIDGT